MTRGAASRPALRGRSALGPGRARHRSLLRRASAQREFLSSLVGRSRAERTPLGLLDLEVVNARLASSHESLLVELPQLVAVAAPPLAFTVVAFVLEAHGDAILVE